LQYFSGWLQNCNNANILLYLMDKIEWYSKRIALVSVELGVQGVKAHIQKFCGQNLKNFGQGTSQIFQQY